MLATIPVQPIIHLIIQLHGAVSTMKIAQQLPHWAFYPACALAVLIVVAAICNPIICWAEQRYNKRSSEIN